MPRRSLWKSLYVQVLVGIFAGVVLGYYLPETGARMRPLGDGFIKLIRMLIAPIVFCTVVVGIAQMSALKELGRIGLRAMIYFEVVSSLALVIGLIVVTLVEPGVGINVDQTALDTTAVASYTTAAKSLTATDFVLNIIPTTFVDAFAKGEILPVLLLSVLSGSRCCSSGTASGRWSRWSTRPSQALFQIVGMIMRLAPIGAFGATAFTIGRYGVGTLVALGKLMFSVYATCGLFVFIVLGIDREDERLQPVEAAEVHQGRDPDRPRHVIVRVGAAADDGQARTSRLLEGGRRARGADRLLVQPRWHVDLHDDGRRSSWRRRPTRTSRSARSSGFSRFCC